MGGIAGDRLAESGVKRTSKSKAVDGISPTCLDEMKPHVCLLLKGFHDKGGESRMEKFMLIVVLMTIFLHGCASTSSSSTNRRYYPPVSDCPFSSESECDYWFYGR